MLITLWIDLDIIYNGDINLPTAAPITTNGTYEDRHGFITPNAGDRIIEK